MNGTRHHHPKRHQQSSASKLQIYAFWTGLMSTVISLVHVIIIAMGK